MKAPNLLKICLSLVFSLSVDLPFDFYTSRALAASMTCGTAFATAQALRQSALAAARLRAESKEAAEARRIGAPDTDKKSDSPPVRQLRATTEVAEMAATEGAPAQAAGLRADDRQFSYRQSSPAQTDYWGGVLPLAYDQAKKSKKGKAQPVTAADILDFQIQDRFDFRVTKSSWDRFLTWLLGIENQAPSADPTPVDQTWVGKAWELVVQTISWPTRRARDYFVDSLGAKADLRSHYIKMYVDKVEQTRVDVESIEPHVERVLRQRLGTLDKWLRVERNIAEKTSLLLDAILHYEESLDQNLEASRDSSADPSDFVHRLVQYEQDVARLKKLKLTKYKLNQKGASEDQIGDLQQTELELEKLEAKIESWFLQMPIHADAALKTDTDPAIQLVARRWLERDRLHRERLEILRFDRIHEAEHKALQEVLAEVLPEYEFSPDPNLFRHLIETLRKGKLIFQERFPQLYLSAQQNAVLALLDHKKYAELVDADLPDTNFLKIIAWAGNSRLSGVFMDKVMDLEDQLPKGQKKNEKLVREFYTKCLEFKNLSHFHQVHTLPLAGSQKLMLAFEKFSGAWGALWPDAVYTASKNLEARYVWHQLGKAARAFLRRKLGADNWISKASKLADAIKAPVSWSLNRFRHVARGTLRGHKFTAKLVDHLSEAIDGQIDSGEVDAEALQNLPLNTEVTIQRGDGADEIKTFSVSLAEEFTKPSQSTPRQEAWTYRVARSLGAVRSLQAHVVALRDIAELPENQQQRARREDPRVLGKDYQIRAIRILDHYFNQLNKEHRAVDSIILELLSEPESKWVAKWLKDRRAEVSAELDLRPVDNPGVLSRYQEEFISSRADNVIESIYQQWSIAQINTLRDRLGARRSLSERVADRLIYLSGIAGPVYLYWEEISVTVMSWLGTVLGG